MVVLSGGLTAGVVFDSVLVVVVGRAGEVVTCSGDVMFGGEVVVGIGTVV